MRNACPLKSNAVIGDHIGTEIELVQLMIFTAENICGEGNALFAESAHNKLKLRKHSLAVDSTLEFVEEMVEEIFSGVFVRGLAEQMVHKQHLVAGGSDLGHKDDIGAGTYGLILSAEIAMESVTHLVSQSEHCCKIVLIVHKNIGVGTAAAGGVSAGALAFIFIKVDPAVIKALLKHFNIVIAQNLKSLENGLLCLFYADIVGGVGNKGRINIPHMQLAEPKHLLSEGDIAVHFVHIVVDGFNEVVIYLNGDFGAIQSGFESVGIFSCLCKKAKLLELSVHSCGYSVFELTETVIICVEYISAEIMVGTLHKRSESAVGEGILPAFGILHIRELQFRVAENAAYLVGSGAHLLCGGQKLLLLGSEGVLTHTAYLLKRTAVNFKLRFGGEKRLQSFVGNFHYLRVGKSRRTVGVDVAASRFADKILIKAVCRILIAAAACIAIELAKAHGNIVLKAQILKKHFWRTSEPTFVCLKHSGEGFLSLIFFQPGLIAFKHMGEIPGVFGGNFTSFQDGFGCHLFYLRFFELKHYCDIIA